MDIEQTIRGIKPLCGRIVPIRTIQETRPPEEFADAYVAEVNVKAASKVIKALDAAFPRDSSLQLSHLRRFAKRELLPAPLRSVIEEGSSSPATSAQTIFVLISPPLPDTNALQALLAPFAPPATPVAVTPSADAPLDSSTTGPALSKIHLHTTKVPLYPPFNTHQAETWTKSLWPVIFNPAAPRATIAPPPQILGRAQDSIQSRAGYYLSLAQKVADEASQSGRGRGVGAVIVDPALEAQIDAVNHELDPDRPSRWPEAVLAVAGDARYARPEAGEPSQAALHAGVAPNPASKTYNADLEGGPELHALMRAVEMVARWRREEDRRDQASLSEEAPHSWLSPLESYFLYQSHPPSRSPAPDSPSSPRKRKHEAPNPESSACALDPQTDLPAPPPSSVALPDPTITHSTHTETGNPLPASSASPSHSAPAPTSSRIRTRSQGGYLCTDLDVYISHEPCLCCSMGMLLSRFRAVVFPRSGRMESGGLASEPVVTPTPDDRDDQHGGGGGATTGADAETGTNESLDERIYYGLHWRKELNWRALGFEFLEDEELENKTAVVFNA
ncbi:hypothetical protein NUU61_002551 [Penicillium alfredii]|uniref:CMP/dCMP-type deaminase domain-containing protein n=1 Tax=Penicillium alfredii TaxID=1506179 RepID=A0A9W9FRR9_9EURO|nr:uncharacterized protein NUU61_002551 [Penicillium alfredii]KAJ5105204.1 hypothetical protein NUU61_002551 [Penicillium alfredii]